MHYFYVLKSEKDNKLYKGFTHNLDERLADHNSGKVFATKYRRPLKMIYNKKFDTEKEAIYAEKYYKSLEGGKDLAKIIKNL